MRLPNEKNVEELLAADHRALDVLVHAMITEFHVSNESTTFARLDLFWARLAMHIRAENLHLFPAILNAVDANLGVQENMMFDPVEVVETLNQLRRDHDFFMHELATAVNLMRECLVTDHCLTTSEPLVELRQIISRITERLKSHNKLEEEVVYGLPARLLSPAKQSELAAQVRRELENLPPRFSTGWQISRRSEGYDGG